MYCILNNGFAYYVFAIAKFKERYFIYEIFTIIELGCFLFYIKQIIKNKKLVKYPQFIFVIFLAFDIIDYFFLRQDKSFNSTTTGIEAVLIITFCLYYFYEQLKEANTLLIYTTHDFWIIIGFLIYSSGTFFLYLYAETTLQDQAFRRQYVIINSVFFLLKNILFSIAMFMKPEPKSEPDFPNDSLMSDWNNIRSFKNVN